MAYNLLNLPASATKGTGGDALESSWTYLADGTKIGAYHSWLEEFDPSIGPGFPEEPAPEPGPGGSGVVPSGPNALQDPMYAIVGKYYIYAGPFRLVQEIFPASITLESVSAVGGRFVMNGNSIQQRYFITDHLGSTRVVLNNAGSVLERYDYYPYGEKVPVTVANTGNTDYLYTGKESQNALFGINWYDSGARFQTTDGIFTGIDPLAEKYYHISPYAYCAGNPVNCVDPTGMDRYYVDSLGTVTRIEQSKDVVLISQCGAKTSLKDSTLISKLLTTTDGRSFGRSEDASSAYQLFKFLADNCVVEWSIHFDNSGGATVGTNHNTENAANWSSYGLTERPLRSIHSHPGINPNPVDEISSMGYYIVNPNNYREVQRIYDSDWDHLITSPNQMARSVYVYFPNTGNTYYISKNGWRKM